MFRWLQVWKDNESKKTKLIASQFKLLHRRLATNDFLRKIGIKDKGMCTFCEAELENLTHLVDNWQKLCNNTGYRPYLIHLNWFVTKGFHKPKKSISFFWLQDIFIWICWMRWIPRLEFLSFFITSSIVSRL